MLQYASSLQLNIGHHCGCGRFFNSREKSPDAIETAIDCAAGLVPVVNVLFMDAVTFTMFK